MPNRKIRLALPHRSYLILAVYILVLACPGWGTAREKTSFAGTDRFRRHGLHFDHLPRSWDEGIPLGNGMLGALVWQRENQLRVALDRADLWDLRGISEFNRPEFKFSWVIGQVGTGNYEPVQDLFDAPYDRDAAPTKLPAAGLEFSFAGESAVRSVDLRLEDAVCVVRWNNGMRFETFVQADDQRGWFRIDGTTDSLTPIIDPPPFASTDTLNQAANSGPGGNDLRRLGYPLPEIRKDRNRLEYRQACKNGMSFLVSVLWMRVDAKTIVGTWTITTSNPYPLSKPAASIRLSDVTLERYSRAYYLHAHWWKTFWDHSSLALPDSVLERQWFLEQYKFGSASRRGAPPITLQAVWTADNGRLPPWKGDFHNDLNTQLSYWPCYTGNHLEEGLSFLDWLWQCKPTWERFTRSYFETSGLNAAGVATLTGEPMGGWIQYALSPTVSAWLAQHFYMHWRYSMDSVFLKARAYPWVRAVAIHLDELSRRTPGGKRQLPLSSSPEINDNRIDAWFTNSTNFDLALIRWLYTTAEELAHTVGETADAERWHRIQAEWPELALSVTDQKLLVAPGYELKESHRHFSHLMAIHPLGLLDWNKGESDRRVISASLADIERLGTDWWCGYSYAWLGNLWARAHNGEKASEALYTFATCFCLPNSFHANGDQSHTGKSKFTYRPFTLEGNFAFAAGVEEMLLQSHGGVVRVFPAIPVSWKNVSFANFRAEGAFLVSGQISEGRLDTVHILAEKGGTLRLSNPFPGRKYTLRGASLPRSMRENDVLVLSMKPGTEIVFTGGAR